VPIPRPWLAPAGVFALCVPLVGAFALCVPLAAAASAVESAGSCMPAESRPEPATRAGRALERGNDLAERGDHAAALEAFAESERLARAGGEPAIAMLAEASSARSDAALGRVEGIPERLDALSESASKLESAELRARVLIHVGRTLARIARKRRAAETLIEATAQAQKASAWRLHSYALGYLAELYESDARYDDALPLTRRALFSGQRANAPDAIYRWQWQLGRIQRSLGDAAAALTSYRLAIATLRDARELTSSGVEPLYEGFVELLLARADPADDQAELAEIRNALEDLKASELRDYFRDPCLDAQRKAAPDTVPGTLVVYPVVLEHRIVLIASLEGVLSSHEMPVEREVFIEEIRDFRRTLEERTTRRYLRPAEQLYRWLIGPLTPMLASGTVETLVFVPRGAIHTIPLAALHDPDSGRFLIEQVPVAVIPGLTLTEPRPIDRSEVTLLAAGISEPVQGFAGLDSVVQEVDAVSEIFPGERLLNRQFEADELEREVSQRPFEIVHLATHGEFAADVSQSYLLTYDGRISMGQLAQLVGTTRFRERALELLTLSACETAAGDDRAALGLAGVALNAGARSALATLWAVNDQVAAELVVAFYRQLADPALTRAQALQRAQLSILRQRPYRHPAFWAPYLLISSWL
jgi:CHAT domain-containing protein